MLPEAAVVLMRVTLLLLAALVFLRFARRLPPRIRHLACLLTMAASLMMLVDLPIAALAPESPIFTVRALEVADVSGLRILSSARWTWAEAAASLWACGCAIVLLRFLIGAAVLWRVRRSALPMGADQRVLLADVKVPMATGLFRPVVLLPRDAANWARTRRDAVLRHETAHLERHDLRNNFFLLIVCAIYWFHPLAWVVLRRSREEQEAACDDLVVEGGFDSETYAEALLDAGRASCPDGTLIASCPMTRRNVVKERIVRVLSPAERVSSRILRRWQRTVIAGVMAVFVISAAVGTEPIYTVGGAVTAPVVIRSIPATYTDTAMAAKKQGRVRLSMVIGDDGSPHDIVVTQGIDPGMDCNAVAAVRAWKLRPAIRNNTPVAVRATVEVNFRLK